ncbi:hypothetical protein SPRG_02576 [Saprolegnia parasitica CBS 223.65]|uniref:Uncharacterized protein n=1 Tax=Saprolegnia parasitica (strain CBS 223.65) TaxID=695850 RepID=A0A067CQA2_SAPPC|nr:hypothetical protein SPRG_02576 [Saprolegnia parasitica CBS 223.65]KDO32884.1 hypothetical protein SPRG_02576 [Saprolegnia parasitica CBS 223.65]|eukprot:XP_012196535.1 hypothetical protein SPRG_02576 [Saprolegnia parasitica CBS 223.65]
MSHWTAINPVGQSPSLAPIKRVREAGRAPSTPDGDASPPPSPRKKRSKRSLMETEEALEARLTASYEKTLRSHDKPAVATGMYVEILQFIASLDDMGALSTTTRKIQYLCLKNLARLEAKSDPNATERALQHYADALDIDTTDCLVWYEAGCVAFQLQQFGLARAYLEEAFALDACFWPMVYKLVLVLYVLQDEAECLRVVKHVLAHDPKHPVATYLDGKLSGQCSAIVPCPASVVAAEAQRAHTHTQLPATRHSNVLAYTLQDNSWASLGALLLELFDEAHASVDDASLSMHQSIVILPSPAAAPVEVAPPVKTEVAANTSMVITAPSVPEIINISDDDDDDDDDVVIVEAISVPDSDAATAKPLNAVVASLRKSSDADPASPATQSRRTSHRTQKRMQDEIEAAIKEAKEKDIAYQLLSFIDKDADAAVPHDTSIYDTHVRAEMAPDGSALRFFRGANEEATLELAPAVAKELLSSPLSSPLPDEDALTSLVLSVEGFLGSLSSTKGHSLEALMVEFLEAVAQHPGVALGNDLLRIVRLMDCSLRDAPDARPVLASPDLHLSLSCRLFLLELHVDALIAGYDPLMHSRVEFFAALQRQQQQLLRWKLDVCETASDALDATLDLRFRWLQIHLDEHLGHVDAVLNALQALQTLLGSSVLALGNVATFPRLSRSAVERKLQKQALTVLAKQVCDRFALVDPSTTTVETEIVDLVLPHYDPRAGKGSRVEDLVLQFRLYLLQMYDWKKATSPLAKPAPPLLTMLIKCLVRLERDDVCYELLCLSWYYILQHQATTTDKTTVQCLKYVTSQLQTVFAKKPYITPAYLLLHQVCAFQCRDFMLRHFHSSSLLNILAQTLPSAHVPSLVGKILHQLTSIDLRKRGNTSLLALSLSALQLLYQHLKTMDASTTIPPALAKALSSSIAVYLKTQIEAGKFRAQSRYTTSL